MKFLGGLAKFLSILLMLLGTIGCTVVIIMVGIVEGEKNAIWIMSLAWIFFMLFPLAILGIGIALSQLVKLKKQVATLEQRLWNLSVTTPAKQEETTTEVEIPATVVPVQPITPVEPVAPEAPVVPAPPVVAKKRKLWIPIVIASVLVIAIVIGAIFILGDKQSEENIDIPIAGVTEFTEPTVATEPMEACPITVNAFCVDDSYVDDEGSPLKMVYMLYTITANDSNLKIDSKYTNMSINSNTYESDHFADEAAACKYMENYYYGSYIRDVYVGDTMNVVATFYIPEGDLEGGKTVTLADTQIPGVESLSFNTDEFLHFSNPMDLAAAMDPEGFEHIMYLREDADMETTMKVRNQINGYCWSFYVNNVAYELEFWANNNFSLTTAFGTQTGTYTVQNGYVFCTYPDTGYTVEIPYTFENGEIDLDTIAGFDVFA